MRLFPNLKKHILELQNVAAKIVKDLSEDGPLLREIEQLESLVLARPHLLPGILAYAKSLARDADDGQAGGQAAEAGPALVDAEQPVAQTAAPEAQGRGDDNLVPAGGDGVKDGAESGGDLDPRPFRVVRHSTALGAAAQPTNGAADGRPSATHPQSVAAATPQGCSGVSELGVPHAASDTPADVLDGGPAADGSGFGLALGRRSLQLGAETVHIVERDLQLADLLRPFTTAGDEGPAADADEESPTDLEVAAAARAPAGPADMDAATATPEGAEAMDAAASAPVGAEGTQAAAAAQEWVVDTAVATAAASPAGVQAVMGLGSAAGPGAAACTEVNAGPEPATAQEPPAAVEARANPHAEAVAEAAAASVALYMSATEQATPLAVRQPEENALMEEAEYHTPQSASDDQEVLDTPPPALEQPPRVPALQAGQAQQQQQDLANAPPQNSALAAEAEGEEEEAEEDDTDALEHANEGVLYYYGQPARGMCTNWPGAWERDDREQWEIEFRHRARVQREDGTVQYLLSYKNVRREMLKFFLENTGAALLADGPGAGEDEDDEGGVGGGFFVSKGSRTDAAGFADDGVDPEQDEFERNEFLNEIRLKEEDEHDEEFVSEGSDDEGEVEGGDAAAAAVGLPAAAAADEEEDLAETAAMDDGTPPRRRTQPVSPAADATASAKTATGGGGSGAGGGAAMCKKGAQVRRSAAPTAAGGNGARQSGGSVEMGVGLGISNSLLSDNMREMLQALVKQGALAANHPQTQIETRYTAAAMQRLIKALMQDVARIRAEWKASRVRLELEAKALRWWHQARAPPMSALASAGVAAGLIPAHTNADLWRLELLRLEGRIDKLCLKVATTYVDNEAAFLKEKAKYADVLEETVHGMEELKVKLLAAGKGEHEAKEWQQEAAEQLRALRSTQAEKAEPRRRKSKKGGDTEDVAGGGGGAAGAGKGESENDKGREDESEDGSYDSSFINDDDVEGVAHDAEGMEAGPDDAAENSDSAPSGPTSAVALKPNQTEVLLGFKAVQKQKARKKQRARGQLREQERLAEAGAEEAAGAAGQEGAAGQADAAAGPKAGIGGAADNTGSGAGDAIGGDGAMAAADGMDVDERGTPPAAAAVGTDGPNTNADTTAAYGDAAAQDKAGRTEQQGRGDAAMADGGQHHHQQRQPTTPTRAEANDDDAEDVQLTRTVEVPSKRVGKTARGAKAKPVPPPPAAGMRGSQADLRLLGPQAMAKDVTVDVMLLPVGGEEPPGCRSMYRAWQEGGSVVEVLPDGNLRVAMKGGPGPSTSTAAPVTYRELPASSLRPALDSTLKARAGDPPLRRGALLQVREVTADGRVLWKPVLVLAVVHAYDKAVAARWASLRGRLPGQVPVRPAWKRCGDWTWAKADGAGGDADADGAAAAIAREGDMVSRYGDASYIDALGTRGAAGSTAGGPAEPEPLHVRLLYLSEYLKKDRGFLDEWVKQVPIEELLGERSAMPLTWWMSPPGRLKGAWHVVEGDSSLERIEVYAWNRVTDVWLVQKITRLRKEQKQQSAQEADGGGQKAQSDEAAQPQTQQARWVAAEERSRNQLVRLVARRLRRRCDADVPTALKRIGQVPKIVCAGLEEGKGAHGAQEGPRGKPKSEGAQARGRKRRRAEAEDSDTEPGHEPRQANPIVRRDADEDSVGTGISDDDEVGAAGDKNDSDFIIQTDGDDADKDGGGAGGAADEAADRKGARRGKGRGGSAVRGGTANKKAKLDESARTLQLQKQLQKQRQEAKRLRQQAMAKKQAAGWEVQGGDEGSRPLFEGRPAPKLAACFAKCLKAHQLKGLRFLWENLVDNHLTDDAAEADTAGGCILAHSMGLGKTLSTIAFLHMFLGQQALAVGGGGPDGGRGGGPDDGLQGRRRALLVVPSNVLFNFYGEFFMWLPTADTADEALSLLTSKKVFVHQADADSAVDSWYSEEGSVLLMSSRKFISNVLKVAKGFQADVSAAGGGGTSAGPKRRGRPLRDRGNGTGSAQGAAEAAPRVESAEGADVAVAAGAEAGSGEEAAEAELEAPTDPKQARKQKLRSMLLEGAGLVVVDEAHELRNPNSQLYKAMCALATRRRLALTGYPLQNNLEEYYTMLTWVQGDLLGTPDVFRHEFAAVIKKGQQANASRRERMESNKRLSVLNEITADFIDRAGPEILERELLPKSEVVLLLDMNDRQREFYQAYLKALEGLPQPKRNKLFRDFEVLRKVLTHPPDFEHLLERAVAAAARAAAGGGGKVSIIQADENDGEDEDIQFQVTPVQTGGRSMQHAPSAEPPGGGGGGGAVETGATDGIADVARALDFGGEEEDAVDPAVAGVAAAGGAAGGSKTAAPGRAQKGKKTVQLPLELCERLLNQIKERRAELSEGGNGDGEAQGQGGVDPLWGPLPKQVFVEKLMRVCHEKNEKLVVFSQSLNVLNALQAMMLRQFRYKPGVELFRIDGAVVSQQRQKIIDRFNKREESRVMLVSSRAGSLGINLTTACRMVIFDVPWNPVFNAQAIARIYRFGQTRPTFVYRLLYAATLEELVYDLNVDKEELFSKVVDKKLVRKAQPSAAERWTYSAPTRLPPEAARRRLEDLADPVTAAAMLAAATGAASGAAPRTSAGGGVALGPNGMAAVDAKDYALLQLAKEPDIQAPLVNAYLHKSKLPPDPLGDLTAEDMRTARQEYQAEVGGDGSRRLRRLRRRAPEEPMDARAAGVAGGGGGGGAVQATGRDGAQNGGAPLRGLSGPVGAAAAAGEPAVDPALEDWAPEEEEAGQLAQRRQQQQQQEERRQQEQVEARRRFGGQQEDEPRKHKKHRERRQPPPQQQQEEQGQQQQQRAAPAAGTTAAATGRTRSVPGLPPGTGGAHPTRGGHAMTATAAAELVGPQPSPRPGLGRAHRRHGGADQELPAWMDYLHLPGSHNETAQVAPGDGPLQTGEGGALLANEHAQRRAGVEIAPEEDSLGANMRLFGMELAAAVAQQQRGRGMLFAAAGPAAEAAEAVEPAGAAATGQSGRYLFSMPPYSPLHVHGQGHAHSQAGTHAPAPAPAQAPAAAPVPGPAFMPARHAPPLPDSFLQPKRKQAAAPAAAQLSDAQPRQQAQQQQQQQQQEEHSQKRQHLPSKYHHDQQQQEEQQRAARAGGTLYNMADAPEKVVRRALVPLSRTEEQAATPVAQVAQGHAASGAAAASTKRRRPEDNNTRATEGPGATPKRQRPAAQPQLDGADPPRATASDPGRQQPVAQPEQPLAAGSPPGAGHGSARKGADGSAAGNTGGAGNGGAVKTPRPKMRGAKTARPRSTAAPTAAGGAARPAAAAGGRQPMAAQGGAARLDGTPGQSQAPEVIDLLDDDDE